MSFSPFGPDLFGDAITPINRGPLATRFEWPPFSVLDARSGDWQERKRAWISLGIKSEIGRGEFVSGVGRPLTWVGRSDTDNLDEVSRKILAAHPSSGTSLFDPVLAELMYRWFCPPWGQIVDPFAGGSVRGIVAGLLGYRYWGCDLSRGQIEANEEQRASICGDQADRIVWTCGDAKEKLTDAPMASMVFTCPPYGNLERYSEDPRDLSAMTHPEFLATYRAIVGASARRLLPGGFLVLVVGDFRDRKTGYYRGFVADTIQAGRDAGVVLYNDAILVTAVGSLSIRVGKQFASGRKLGKTHQNVLVFLKP